MNSPFSGNQDALQGRLDSFANTVMAIAREHRDDCDRLLRLLRTLETLHREIRVGMFEPSLPNTRKALYGLLRDMEETGGWPYIERMKLQSLLEKLRSDELPEIPAPPPAEDWEK